MSTLKITSKGQVTLRREVLDHLGVAPGQHVEVSLLPNGRVQVAAAQSGDISEVFGLLKDRTRASLTIDQIKELTEQGWAGEARKTS
jgi:bifunctional DNA-binding transcriptional regulator/antitoxin component of YhaV-PrlF toxin-antitoxin module